MISKLPALINLVHGSKDGVEKLVIAFLADHANFAKAHIEKRIKEIAKKERHPDGHGSMRWVVFPELLAAHAVEVKINDLNVCNIKY